LNQQNASSWCKKNGASLVKLQNQEELNFAIGLADSPYRFWVSISASKTLPIFLL